MKYFVKAKFESLQVEATGARITPELKQRFPTRDEAFTFAAEQLDKGATSITIRPEQDK
jgi:hypothetical protein